MMVQKAAIMSPRGGLPVPAVTRRVRHRLPLMTDAAVFWLVSPIH